ncbi:MAG: hypothetical protein ACKVP4_10960 [Hyphomicrobium sp.]
MRGENPYVMGANLQTESKFRVRPARSVRYLLGGTVTSAAVLENATLDLVAQWPRKLMGGVGMTAR